MSFKVGSIGRAQHTAGTQKTSAPGKFDKVMESKSAQKADTVAKEAPAKQNALEQFRALVNKGASPEELVRVALQSNPLFKDAPNFKVQVQQQVIAQIKDNPTLGKIRG